MHSLRNANIFLVTMAIFIAGSTICFGYGNSVVKNVRHDGCMDQSTKVESPYDINKYVIIKDTLCDNVAHSNKISIYVYNNTDRYLLLSYETDSMSDMPSIKWDNSKHITVSVNVVSEIYSINEHIESINVTYNIGKILFINGVRIH